jgi:sulfoxide reductase heme-binding subunit YedZ
LKRPKFTPWQIGVHIGAWLPLLVLLFDAATGRLTVNPIQAATQRTGLTALSLLALSLACTPAAVGLGWKEARRLSRPLGLYAFLYAVMHLTIFVWIDYGLDLALLGRALLEKRFIWVGLAAFVILTALAATSFRPAMKRLGKNWKRLHRLVYLAAPLVLLHYAWALKGNLSSLQGNLTGPLLFAAGIGLLLILRLPAVKRLRGNARPKPTARPQVES